MLEFIRKNIFVMRSTQAANANVKLPIYYSHYVLRKTFTKQKQHIKILFFLRRSKKIKY